MLGFLLWAISFFLFFISSIHLDFYYQLSLPLCLTLSFSVYVYLSVSIKLVCGCECLIMLDFSLLYS
jgi:hypothetical protein